jgi:branched-chain amino acid transport system substrate-binding protein
LTTPRPASKRLVRLLAPMLAFALLAAACGDDDDTSADDTTTTAGDTTDDTTSDGDGDDASDALGEPNPASGDPVKVGLLSAATAESALSAQFQRVEEGMNAAVEYANEYRGGIAGRPIELFICQGGETPAGAQDCANQFVNEDVIAVVLPFTGNGASIVPVLAGAGIPYFTGSATANEELTTEGVFALSGGYPAGLAAFAAHARDNGVEKLAMLAIDVPAALQAAEGIGNIVFANAGVDYEVIPTPLGTADMTPQMQSAVGTGADAIAMTGDLAFCSSFLQAYETLGLDQTRYLIQTCIDPTNLEAYPDLIEGSIMTGSTTTDLETEDARLYAAIAETFGGFDPDPTVSAGHAGGVSVFLSFLNLMDTYEGDTVDADAVMEHAKTATDVPVFLGEGATYTCDGTAIPLLPTVCTAEVLVGPLDSGGQIQSTEIVDVGPLFEMG